MCSVQYTVKTQFSIGNVASAPGATIVWLRNLNGKRMIASCGRVLSSGSHIKMGFAAHSHQVCCAQPRTCRACSSCARKAHETNYVSRGLCGISGAIL